jgi:uroporphyrin-3 C-methyltransferase
MTDKNSETSPAGSSAAVDTQASSSSSNTPSPATSAASKKKQRSAWLPAFVGVVVVALLLVAALWRQQQQFNAATGALSSQVQASVNQAQQADSHAKQALSLAQEQARRIAALDTSARESREQLQGLDQAFRSLTDSGSDLVLLNDVDHLVTIAQQQLQLSGNVANAIISLETAQAQLSRANRPALASLQQTINGDLDRLRAASTIDISMLSTQLDDLASLLGTASLLVPDDAAPDVVSGREPAAAAPSHVEPPASVDAKAPWWRQAADKADAWSRQAWTSLRTDLGQFITVRRVDDPTALLMSPDQATRFRETLRLRIMTAQLALMMRQPKVWRSETDALVKAIEMRYDPKDRQTRQALKLARDLADTSIDVKLPTVDNSLQAVAAIMETNTNKAEQRAVDAAPETSDNHGVPGNGPSGSSNDSSGSAAPTDPAPAAGQD